MNFELIAKALVKSMFYGNWVAETPNERVIQMLLEKEGLWPIESEEELVEKTHISDDVYIEAKNYFNPGVKIEDVDENGLTEGDYYTGTIYPNG